MCGKGERFLYLFARPFRIDQATGHHQNEVNMKGPILVGFFLAGLVIHGGCQGWWISVLLTSIDNTWVLMIGSTVLTAFNDNAAITYLASQAPGLSIGAKYAVLAGAVQDRIPRLNIEVAPAIGGAEFEVASQTVEGLCVVLTGRF